MTIKEVFTVTNDWTDLGWLVGIIGVYGFVFHWSHFMILGFVLSLTYLMRRKEKENKNE